MARKRKGPSTAGLLLRLPQQLGALAKAEYANAKKEMGGAVKKLIIGAVCIVLALFFIYWSIAAFGASAILGIAEALPAWLAALIVAVGLLLLGALSVLIGFLLVKRGNPVPEKTLDRVGDDLAVASSIKYNTDPDARIYGVVDDADDADDARERMKQKRSKR